jgi:hypothetical protein
MFDYLIILSSDLVKNDKQRMLEYKAELHWTC